MPNKGRSNNRYKDSVQKVTNSQIGSKKKKRREEKTKKKQKNSFTR